jgi:hypothetical protein
MLWWPVTSTLVVVVNRSLAYRKHTTTQKSMSDQFASELKGNRLQLRIQLKHWRFVSLRAVAHTLLRVVRLQFGVQR